MKFYDCFLFNNELDLLEIRLKYLWDVVDTFVIVEADATFAGKEKPLHFEENKERFKWAESKIKHVVKKVDRDKIDFTDESAEASLRHATFRWDLERSQRNYIETGVESANDEDFVMLGDVDEIPRKSVIEKILKEGLSKDDKPIFLNLINCYYFLNCQATGENRWFPCCSIFKKKILGKPLVTSDAGFDLVNDFPEDMPDFMKQDLIKNKESIIEQYPLATLQKIRDARWTFELYENAGWHFSYVGNIEFIKNKIGSISHTEYDTPEYKNNERIEKAINKGEDLFGRDGHKFKYVDMNENSSYDEDLIEILSVSKKRNRNFESMFKYDS